MILTSFFVVVVCKLQLKINLVKLADSGRQRESIEWGDYNLVSLVNSRFKRERARKSMCTSTTYLRVIE